MDSLSMGNYEIAEQGTIFDELDPSTMRAICLYGYACSLEDCLLLSDLVQISEDLSPEALAQAKKLYRKVNVRAKYLVIDVLFKNHPEAYLKYIENLDN